MTSFAIAMPSNRSLLGSMDAIQSALNYTDRLFIADNSGDPQKMKLYMDSNAILKISPAEDMVENFKYAVDRAPGDFILIMQDDDRILRLSDAKFDIPDDVVGVKPQMVAFNSGGIQMINVSPITADTPMKRIEQMMQVNAGCNGAFHTFWRKDLIKKVMDIFASHPTRGTYLDWAAVLSLASAGKVIVDPGTAYFFNTSHWEGTQAEVDAYAAQAYEDVGVKWEWRDILQTADFYVFVKAISGIDVVKPEYINYDFLKSVGLYERYHGWAQSAGVQWG